MSKYTDENGRFKSNYEKNRVGYLVERMQWVFHHNNISIEDKRRILLQFEEHYIDHINEMFPAGNFTYERLSDKLK